MYDWLRAANVADQKKTREAVIFISPSNPLVAMTVMQFRNVRVIMGEG